LGIGSCRVSAAGRCDERDERDRTETSHDLHVHLDMKTDGYLLPFPRIESKQGPRATIAES
jgi:hypothetical protein